MTSRAVFDCMIYIQALARKNGPAARCVELALSGACELIVSAATIAEIRDVAGRPQLRKRFIRASDDEIREFLERVISVATLVDEIPEVFSLKRDPEDSKYINLAVAAKAKLIVSRDNDLLDLMTGTDADAESFRAAYPDIAILDPIAFLQSLRSDPTSTPEAP